MNNDRAIITIQKGANNWVRVRWPYDGNRHYDPWVTISPIDGVDIHTYEDGTPIDVEIRLPVTDINIEGF